MAGRKKAVVPLCVCGHHKDSHNYATDGCWVREHPDGKYCTCEKYEAVKTTHG